MLYLQCKITPRIPVMSTATSEINVTSPLAHEWLQKNQKLIGLLFPRNDQLFTLVVWGPLLPWNTSRSCNVLHSMSTARRTIWSVIADGMFATPALFKTTKDQFYPVLNRSTTTHNGWQLLLETLWRNRLILQRLGYWRPNCLLSRMALIVWCFRGSDVLLGPEGLQSYCSWQKRSW